jgi:hypothetical protein
MDYNLKNLGQTTIEYILFLTIVVAIALTAFQRIKESLVENNDSFLKTLFSNLESSISSSQTGGKFKKFRFKP